MKTILAVCIMMAVLAGAGYYGLPPRVDGGHEENEDGG